MKASAFSYRRPTDLGEAIALLSDTDSDVAALAGGQSLMAMMNFRVAAPDMLVDLADLAELRGISTSDAGLRIGAMTSYTQLSQSDEVAVAAPMIPLALPHIAHPAIRNRGTIGGSVALADPAAEMPAVLLVMDAEIELVGPRGSRRVAASDFFLGMYETAREADELVTAIHVPRQARERRYGFYELARRHGDYAMAGVALSALRTQTGALDDPRVAVFGVADRAERVPAAESCIAGKATDDAASISAAVEALGAITFNADLNATEDTKQHLTGVCLRRAIREMSA